MRCAVRRLPIFSAATSTLPAAPVVRVLVIPDATHFVFLDRPEHGRTQFTEAVTGFLAK
jgi:pimeloyl-ACP methyl ester carboxylesterase